MCEYLKTAMLVATLIMASTAAAGDPVQLDPFARATNGFSGCPQRTAPVMTPAQARAEAHVRAERGIRCAMDGSCESGGAYRRDPQINERVRDVLARERRFADTSLWVTTTRKWVFVSGCVRTAAQRRSLSAFIGKLPMVERVFDETQIGRR